MENKLWEIFKVEHEYSAEVLARVLLLCELLVEKGYITEDEVATYLSDEEVANFIKESMETKGE